MQIHQHVRHLMLPHNALLHNPFTSRVQMRQGTYIACYTATLPCDTGREVARVPPGVLHPPCSNVVSQHRLQRRAAAVVIYVNRACNRGTVMHGCNQLKPLSLS